LSREGLSAGLSALTAWSICPARNAEFFRDCLFALRVGDGIQCRQFGDQTILRALHFGGETLSHVLFKRINANLVLFDIRCS
jgi:hypothetical protein